LSDKVDSNANSKLDA